MEDLDVGEGTDLVAFVGADGRLAHLNAAGRALLGVDPEVDVTSTRFDRFIVDKALIPTLAAAGRVWSGDTLLRADDVDVEVFLVCTTSPGGSTIVARALDSRRVGERFLADLEREWQSLDDAEDVMALATRRLGKHIGADRCAYARTEADEDHFVMSGDHATGLPNLVGRFAMSQFGEDCLRAMRAGEPWVVADCADDDRLRDDDLAAYETTGIRAVICLPLLKKGRFVAAMAVHQATARRWTAAEVDLVAAVVNRCRESLERTHAARALRDSEQRYRLLVERATDGIWMVDRDLRFVEVNPAGCALLGYEREELLGRSAADLVVSGDQSAVDELTAPLSTTREVNEVWEVRRADGTVLALELSIQGTPTGWQAIARDVTARQRAEAERELLRQHEHEVAEALQRSLLPRQLPVLERLAAAARYLPASTHAQTGGDWYEVLHIKDSTIALSVGDVVGKGPTAAAVMGQLRSALASYLLDGHSPAGALERLDTFALRVNGAVGSTCACLTFDWSNGLLRWAVAGHPPPVLAGSGDARFLHDGGGPVLGVRRRATYREATAVLAPGASIVLYTDGLVERRDAPIDVGLDRLLDVVRAGGGSAPDVLARGVTDAMLAEGHDDDVALLVLRYLPEPLLRLGVPAEPVQLGVMRRSVDAWAAEAGLGADALDDLQLALGEAAANAVDHAYPYGRGDFDYEVARTAEGGIDVVVRDRGRWRPEPADNGSRGRGLRLIKALSERSNFDHGDGTGTTVRFRLAAEAVELPDVSRPAPVGPPADADGEVLAVEFTGDLDLAEVEEVRAGLLARIATAAHLRIQVDLTRLRYLSSSGVALLLDLAAAATRVDSTLTVTAARGSAPARILELSGLDGISTGSNLTVDTAPATS
ncbi:SpoIIE family protein phosphatase [Umezawaea sp. Da 62-37]|uniref:SpoIIE family protein phosphatase n=1 Tax=Umezawaea sp. Da 62-37 TaxID=3075927 RepID=UPI0028F6D8B7|nr:SpoIIE family protein phosphatase [Umezawaea sp. Da 62-37]WNV87159.1 SpoIIE family protein phosphatase [Umezawaea sp. Da 62-37]